MEYKQGDILTHNNRYRKILGVSGEVYFMSCESEDIEGKNLNRHFDGYTEYDLDKNGYRLYTPPEEVEPKLSYKPFSPKEEAIQAIQDLENEYLVYFDTEKEAADAYDKAALVYHREYAYVNDDELRGLLVNVREKLGWIVTSSDDLLEKLPGYIALTSTTWDDVHVYKKDSELDYQACACYQSNVKGKLIQKVADTPLKALLKLCLALKEAGEL